mmetsp:Transcript_45373/g.144654  ORF Transcript_45373/g.144654 Transcript_45373/m.144654 type:complete len:83 (+) Transcript_45373:1297-1545(+)
MATAGAVARPDPRTQTWRTLFSGCKPAVASAAAPGDSPVQRPSSGDQRSPAASLLQRSGETRVLMNKQCASMELASVAMALL